MPRPASIALLLGLLLTVPTGMARTPTYTNPLLPSGPDPWIAHEGGIYYFMSTRGDHLAIRKTTDLSQLAKAAPVTVWTPPKQGPNGQSIWAPELHRIDGRWFIYYTAADSAHDDDAHRGIFVLENTSADPTQGTWIDRGQLKTAHTGIDGTTFAVDGKRYFVYSPYVGPDSVLAIVRMSNPWTLTGPETVIARPDQAWERQGGRQILEGPEFVLGPKGDLFLTYSGSACWSDGYALGLLKAAAGSDPLDAASWIKQPGPVLATDPVRGVFAPGHNGFFRSAEGQTWIVYHANPAADMRCTNARAPHLQPVSWSASGDPVFGRPAPVGIPLTAPGG